jgi:hypothetical protein
MHNAPITMHEEQKTTYHVHGGIYCDTNTNSGISRSVPQLSYRFLQAAQDNKSQTMLLLITKCRKITITCNNIYIFATVPITSKLDESAIYL